MFGDKDNVVKGMVIYELNRPDGGWDEVAVLGLLQGTSTIGAIVFRASWASFDFGFC